MNLRVIASTNCIGGDCPTIYATDGDDVIVQGYVITDPDVLAQIGLPPGETLVRIPRQVLDQAAHG